MKATYKIKIMQIKGNQEIYKTYKIKKELFYKIAQRKHKNKAITLLIEL